MAGRTELGGGVGGTAGAGGVGGSGGTHQETRDRIGRASRTLPVLQWAASPGASLFRDRAPPCAAASRRVSGRRHALHGVRGRAQALSWLITSSAAAQGGTHKIMDDGSLGDLSWRTSPRPLPPELTRCGLKDKGRRETIHSFTITRRRSMVVEQRCQATSRNSCMAPGRAGWVGNRDRREKVRLARWHGRTRRLRIANPRMHETGDRGGAGRARSVGGYLRMPAALRSRRTKRCEDRRDPTSQRQQPPLGLVKRLPRGSDVVGKHRSRFHLVLSPASLGAREAPGTAGFDAARPRIQIVHQHLAFCYLQSLRLGFQRSRPRMLTPGTPPGIREGTRAARLEARNEGVHGVEEVPGLAQARRPRAWPLA